MQGPDGSEVHVSVPSGARPGQLLMVEIDPSSASARTATASSASDRNFSATSQDDLVQLLSVMERDAGEVCRQALRRLTEETQLQVALWASTDTATAEPDLSCRLDIQLASAPKPDLSQTQAIVLAAAEVGDAAQLLAALTEAKKFSTVSLSLEDAARSLRSAEEALLTWRCLRKALDNKDRHEMEVWVEQANSMGLPVPPGVNKVLRTLREQEEQHLEQLLQRHDVQQRLRFAQESGDSELLAQAQAEAERLGIDPQPPAHEQGLPERSPQAYGSSEADSDSRPTRELLDECRRRCLDTTRCQTREDLIQLLRSASAQATPPPAPPRASATSGAAAASPVRQRAAAPAAASPQASSVWERRTVPARYAAHRQYEYLYLLGFDPARGFPSSSDLRAAYRKAAMDSHPDRQQNHARQETAKELFQKVKEAFDYLSPGCK